MDHFTEEAHYAIQFVNQTQRSLFLTGKAGTGKTTLLKEIIRTTHKNTVVVAPTGIAALNAGGVTIHSMFQLPFGGFIPDYSIPDLSSSIKFETKASIRKHFRMNSIKQAVIRNMELLVIDEVSMLRPDLLDAIDFMMQSIRKSTLPFGGTQVLFIGDLLQLPPVISDEEWKLLRQFYAGKFFFNAQVLQQNPPLYIELSKIYRQTDEHFVSILNNLRNNTLTSEDFKVLQQFVQPDFDFQLNPGYITLTTHNNKADSINSKALENLNGKLWTYFPDITDDFPEKMYPLDYSIQLKVGAQVMFVKNDASFEKNYFNGKIGVIQYLSNEEVKVHFPEEKTTITVDKYEWQHIRYVLNEQTKEIEEELLGTYVQYPLKLAWAITVHKSQGLTFDKAALDVSQVFLPGQAYVAFSRLRSLNGLVLLSNLRLNGLSNDLEVMEYENNKATSEHLEQSLALETQKFVHQYLVESFTWEQVAQEWRNHQFSFGTEETNSEKGKNAFWAKNQASVIWQLLESAQKFRNQLNSLFSRNPLDIPQIHSRIQAAYDYFFPFLDGMYTEILYKIEEVKRAKKSKGFYEELVELEQHQLLIILRLMKTLQLIKTFTAEKPITKASLHSEDSLVYKSKKLSKIQEQFKNDHADLIEETSETANRYQKSKSKKEKTPKISTYDITFELWQEHQSIAKIAEIRKLTSVTICSHLAKFIKSGKIAIQDVLSEDKISALSLVFQDYNEDVLTPLKEKVGDSFTWQELRLFQASIEQKNA